MWIRIERERCGYREWGGGEKEGGAGEGGGGKAPCVSNKGRYSSAALFQALSDIDYVQDQSEASHV